MTVRKALVIWATIIPVNGGCADSPRPATATAAAEARVFRSGDQIAVNLGEPFEPGQPPYRVVRVDSLGVIRLQYLGDFQAAGRTEGDLEDAILAALRNTKMDQKWTVEVRRLP